MARSGIICLDPRIAIENVLSRLLSAVSKIGADRVAEIRGGRRWARTVLEMNSDRVVIEALADRGILAVSAHSETMDPTELSLIASKVGRALLGTHRCRKLRELKQ